MGEAGYTTKAFIRKNTEGLRNKLASLGFSVCPCCTFSGSEISALQNKLKGFHNDKDALEVRIADLVAEIASMPSSVDISGTDDYKEIVRQIEEKAKENGGFDDSYDGTRILTVGRLTPQKAYEVAIEAMKLLKEEGIKARWYVVGEGQERNRLEQLIEKYDLKEDFVLLGMKMNPYPYYAQTDIYVHATRYEGKSFAIQEAQVLSCAILVSDCSGNREHVTHGVDGLMCDLSPKAVKDGIVKMLSDKEKMAEYKVNAGNRIKSEKSDLCKLTEILK